jgi:hypothetical protein
VTMGNPALDPRNATERIAVTRCLCSFGFILQCRT